MTVGPHLSSLWQIVSFMSICRTSGRRLLALSTKSSVRSEYVLSGHAILDRSFANGVSSLPHAYQGWSDFASGRQDQRVPKLVTAMVRGFSTNRDEEGSQASQKQESRKESAHRDSRANKDNPLEHEDSACDRSSDHKPPESSGRPEHDTQQDAAAQQEQAPSMDEAAENTQPEQQQQSDSDPLATGMVCCSFFQVAVLPLNAQSQQCSLPLAAWIPVWHLSKGTGAYSQSRVAAGGSRLG